MSQEIPVVYPSPQMDPLAATSHHRSNGGSFGSVFIVLAIIVVISAIACFLGRLCSKRSLKAHDKQSSKDHRGGQEGHGKKQKQAFPKKEWEPKHNQTRDGHGGDIEFGFDSKSRAPSSSAKVAAANNGDHHHPAMAMGPSRSFKGYPGGDHAGAGGMGPQGPMRFPGGGDHPGIMGASRSFRNGGGEMRFPEGGGEHRSAGPVPY